MVSRRKCVLVSIVSISVLWLVISLLFFHRLSDDHSAVSLNSIPAPRTDLNAAQNVDMNSDALAVNSAALKIAALEKENLELRRIFNSAQIGTESEDRSKPINQLPPNPAEPIQLQVPSARDIQSFRAAFDKFEAFVLKPSEDQIPGKHQKTEHKLRHMHLHSHPFLRPKQK